MIGNKWAVALVALIAFVGLTDKPHNAWANTDVNVLISSGMVSRVLVATGTTATRIDNWNRGITGTTSTTLLGVRKSVCWQNTGAWNVFCSVDASISSNTASNFSGWAYAVNDVGCIDAARSMSIYCIASDSATLPGNSITVQQFGVNP